MVTCMTNKKSTIMAEIITLHDTAFRYFDLVMMTFFTTHMLSLLNFVR